MKGILEKIHIGSCRIAAILRRKVTQIATGTATCRPVATLVNDRGEGEVDTVTHIIRDVVLALLVLGLVYALIKTNIFPQLSTSVGNMLNYNG